MLTKTTVLALLTVLCLSAHGDNMNDHNGKGSWDNMGGMMDPNSKQMNQINQQVAGIILFVYFIAFLFVAGINIFLCVKCLKKRSVSKVIKQQMQMRRLEFATNHGFNIQTLNDPRNSQTIHI